MRLPHLLSFELAPLVFPYSISHSGMVCFIAHKRVQVMKLSLGQMLQGDSDKLSYFVEQEIWIRHCANLKTFSTFHRHTCPLPAARNISQKTETNSLFLTSQVLLALPVMLVIFPVSVCYCLSISNVEQEEECGTCLAAEAQCPVSVASTFIY